MTTTTDSPPKPRLRGLVTGLVALIGVLVSFGARADDPCRHNSRGIAVPQCVTQSQSGTLKADQTIDINIYCPPEAPYYWGGWINQFSSIWHVITENLLVEDIFHAHFKISNTRLGDNSFTVTIGCSPLPEFGQCTGNTRNVPDPRCPRIDTREQCMYAPRPKCWEVWTETCIDGDRVTNYTCSNANPLSVNCATCNG